MPWWIWLLLTGSLAEVLLGVFIGWFLAMTSGEFQARALREAVAYVSQFSPPAHPAARSNGHSTNNREAGQALAPRQGERS